VAERRRTPRAATVDIHAHFVPEAYLRLVETDGEPFGLRLRSSPEGHLIMSAEVPIGPITPHYYDLDLRLKAMNAQGVRVHALSLMPPMVYWADAALGLRLARIVNDAMAEAARAGQVFYNSAVLVGPQGVVGVFRKLHDRGEWPVFCSGDEFPLLETSLGRIGALVCYDMCFPETVRTYAVRGAVIASMSTAWPLKDASAPDPEADHYAYVYDTLTRAHAIANQVFFISANQVGPTGRYNYYGHSRIIAPSGVVLADSGREEKLIAAAVDIEHDIDVARTETLFFKNLLRDRRPETYGVLTQP